MSSKNNAGKKHSARLAMDDSPGWSWHSSLRSWPALVIGLVLLGVAAVLYGQARHQTVNDQLIRKLPKDSYAAGIAQLAVLEPDTLKQLANGVQAGVPQTTAVLDAVTQAGVTKDKLAATVEDRFAFASTTHGSLAIFSIKDEAKLPDLVNALNNTVANRQQTSDSGGNKFITGTLPGGGTVAVVRNGRELYVGSTVDLVKNAITESNGFTSVERFAELAKALPAEHQGYLFYNPATVRSRVPLDLPLVGVAFNNKKDALDLSVRTAISTPVADRPAKSDGKLLPPVSQATASIEGMNIVKFVHLLEEQRQESDVPKVLQLQNGLTNLNRTLGADFERDYLSAANGHFVYARYPSANGNEWAGLLEFETPEQALSKTRGLTELVKQKVTVPVRKQVVTILPDGTQSREVVAEGREALTFSDFGVSGENGQSTSLPGNFGQLFFLVHGRYLILGSTADGIGRMLSVLNTPTPSSESGELSVRANVGGVGGLLKDQDTLADWLFAIRPANGHFTLNKASGELTGGVDFSKP